MVLVSKDSALVTSRIQAITVTDVARFFINRVLAPNARAQARASSLVGCSALLGVICHMERSCPRSTGTHDRGRPKNKT
jgi:hypothetical protein